MNRCPKCNRNYSDRTLKFCLEDGNPLSEVIDPDATIVSEKRPRISIRERLDIRTWKHWTRTEKLASLGVVLAAMGIVVAVITWRGPSIAHYEECILYNDIPTEPEVNVRTGCDKNPCDDDSRLVIGAYPNGTRVQRKNTSTLRGKKFNWIQVVILSGGQTVWVAENKVSCKSN